MTLLALTLFALQLTLGACLARLTQKLAGGAWGDTYLAALDSLARKTWITAPAFAINLLFNEVLPSRASHAAVLGRTLLALIAFVWVAHSLNKISRPRLAAALILLFAASTTLTFDWVAGLDKQWNSSILGVLYLGGGFAGAIAIASLRAPRAESANRYLKGNLLFAASCIWAYLVLSQLMVIYMGFEPMKLAYLTTRAEGFWKPVTIAMWTLGFIAPFFILLFRRLKSTPLTLQMLAVAALTARWLEISHWIYPNQVFGPLTFAIASAIALLLTGALVKT